MKLTRHNTTKPALFTLLIVLLPTLAAGAIPGYPAPGKRVYVRDHYMHINCMGQGRPTVVMDSGLGGTSLDWVFIQPQVAKYTRVCTYDRSGYAWSESGSRPRTSSMISNELHLLLDMAGIKGPYVLVGHSFGGFNVRLFANAYPKDTAGLVLVDSSHEQQFERLENVGPGMRLAPRGDFVVLMQPMVSPELPQKLRPMALALMSTYAALDAVRDELAAFRLSAEQVTDHGWLPEVPTVVVTRGERVWPDTIEGDRKEAIWRHMQEDLAHRNGRAVHLIADFSGHYIPLEQPEVVSSAICIAVETARAGNPPRGVPSVWLKQLCHF